MPPPPIFPKFWSEEEGNWLEFHWFLPNYVKVTHVKLFMNFLSKFEDFLGDFYITRIQNHIKTQRKVVRFSWKNRLDSLLFFFCKKRFFCQKQKKVAGRNPNNVSKKIRHDLSLGFDMLNKQIKCDVNFGRK